MLSEGRIGNSSRAISGEESTRLYAYRPPPSRNVYAVCLPYVWREPFKNGRKYGVPTGIRTPVAAVKGRCPRPLDDGDAEARWRESTG